ncbi:unnamed protein product [Amoebophrya sp. A25]|nr:unnamed protein product [Amoebophrya sp. A25]|eukprot:GSA25T00010936001.1
MPAPSTTKEFDISAHVPACIGKFNRIEAASAQGCWVTDTDGRRYLDLSAGIGVLSTGHCHPRVVAAAQAQVATMILAQQNCIFTTEVHKNLVQKLLSIMPCEEAAKDVANATDTTTGEASKDVVLEKITRAPSPLSSFFFCNSGAEAIDNAIKVVRMATGKQNVIVLTGGYHGRTIGSMALTSSKTTYRRCFGPLMAGVHYLEFDPENGKSKVVPPLHSLTDDMQSSASTESTTTSDSGAPHAHQEQDPGFTNKNTPGALKSGEDEQLAARLISRFEMLLTQQTDALETAAVLLEPVLGEGGILRVPHTFLRYLRKRCDELGIMLVLDEVQCGMGRTGTWWACEQANVCPDVLVFAKGIASGFPLAGLALRKEKIVDKLLPNALGGTYGGQAVCLAAASATIDAIRDEGMLGNACERGGEIATGLRALESKLILGIRQYGLFIAVDLAPDLVTPQEIIRCAAAGCSAGNQSENSKTSNDSDAKSGDSGRLIMIPGGRNGLRITPPLCISKDEVSYFLDHFRRLLQVVEKSK